MQTPSCFFTTVPSQNHYEQDYLKIQFPSTILHFGNLQNINTRAFSKNMIINID